MMKQVFRKLLLLVALFVCVSMASAQLPNEKFGKPSSLEWDFVGWGDALDADAIILCKTMNVTYQLSDQVFNNSQDTDISFDNLSDFGKNEIDMSSVLVRYEFRLRTKILKAEGARHANIDITYFCVDDDQMIASDDVSDLKIRVFTKNEKGKVERRNVDTGSFVRERVDDNYMVLHVVVPDVRPGSIIEYQYAITSNRPTFLYDWTFQECIPTVRSKCDIEIPAIFQFKMNVPIHRLIRSSVEAGQLAYDANRPDMKKGKTCATNHYRITGDYIAHPRPLPKGGGTVAAFTSRIVKPDVTPPAYLPEGSTHLKVR